MLTNKKILLGITGSIAAYKSAALVRLLTKAGAEVKVIMTASACDFITPLTLSTLSGNEVLHELATNDSWANHVMLGRWADIMLIAPLSCNTLSKMASGACDNLLLAVYLSATCPVVGAPAMDEDMWHHPSTKANIGKIRIYGQEIIPVNNGPLASGLSGEGRMAEPEEIIAWLNDKFKETRDLSGKKVLITAGPTHEALDPVRFIGNHSSGKMGISLAQACRRRGAEVTMVIGPTHETLPDGIKIMHVTTAREMYDACMERFPVQDIAIMSAAVADYTAEQPSEIKIKKTGDTLTLQLKRTPDILKALGEIKKAGQVLVGFALETDHEKENALKKLNSKNADLIVLNSLKDAGAGFGYSTNKITIFDKAGAEYHFDTKAKSAIADDIIHTIINISHA